MWHKKTKILILYEENLYVIEELLKDRRRTVKGPSKDRRSTIEGPSKDRRKTVVGQSEDHRRIVEGLLKIMEILIWHKTTKVHI